MFCAASLSRSLVLCKTPSDRDEKTKIEYAKIAARKMSPITNSLNEHNCKQAVVWTGFGYPDCAAAARTQLDVVFLLAHSENSIRK